MQPPEMRNPSCASRLPPPESWRITVVTFHTSKSTSVTDEQDVNTILIEEIKISLSHGDIIPTPRGVIADLLLSSQFLLGIVEVLVGCAA